MAARPIRLPYGMKPPVSIRKLAVCVLCSATFVTAEDTTGGSLNHEVESYLAGADAAPRDSTLHASWRNGPVVETEDGDYMVRLRSRLLWDMVGRGSNTAVAVENREAYLRQGRIGLRGRVLGNTVFMIEIDFGLDDLVLMDVFVGLRKLKTLGTLTIGHQREPFSLDGVTPIPFHAFMERATSTNVFAPARNVGVRMIDRTPDERLTWSAGIYTQSDEAFSGNSSGGALFSARVTGLPISRPDARQLLHLGLSVSVRDPPDGIARLDGRPGVRIGPVSLDTGDMPADLEVRGGFEILYMDGSWRVQGEVFFSDVSGETDATFSGWYVSASLWLTGEQAFFVKKAATYGRTQLNRNSFVGKGGRGAIEMSLRVSSVDLNDGDIRGGQQDELTFGVNWHWNPYTRVMLNLGYADVEQGPLGSGRGYNLKIRMQFDF